MLSEISGRKYLNPLCLWGALFLLFAPIAVCHAVQEVPTLKDIKEQDWFLSYLYKGGSSLCYMQVKDNAWITAEIDDLAEFRKHSKGGLEEGVEEILIPVFPTVFLPFKKDKPYFDTILRSAITKGDKVLIIGAGSGSDAWVAWLKSRSRLLYAIEVNPMAIANTYATARLAGFEVRQVLADIRKVKLPEDFREFDYVLWNMPKLIEPRDDFDNPRHDGDDGSVLKAFISLLPSLLKPGGQAIIWNSKAASRYINLPYSALGLEGGVDIYTISNKR